MKLVLHQTTSVLLHCQKASFNLAQVASIQPRAHNNPFAFGNTSCDVQASTYPSAQCKHLCFGGLWWFSFVSVVCTSIHLPVMHVSYVMQTFIVLIVPCNIVVMYSELPTTKLPLQTRSHQYNQL